MADGKDKDGQDIIFNAVDNAIVTHPSPVTGATFEFFIRTAWDWKPVPLRQLLFSCNRAGKF